MLQNNKGTTMLLKMYSIRDQKAEVFNTPFFQKTHGEAERNFHTAANDPQTSLSKYPEDFDLYYLGEYDDNSGRTKPLDTPQHMLKAVQAITNKKASLDALKSAE